jgi:endo-1,4-beta-xylanase
MRLKIISAAIVAVAVAGVVVFVLTRKPTLRSRAQQHGVQIGAAVSIDALRNDEAYRRTLGREFNRVVAENVMKFENVHPERDRYTFEDADEIMRFARRHGMIVHGHTLVWHTQVPDWLEQGDFTSDEMKVILQAHIQTVVGRYRGQIKSWDVVNEAIADDGTLRKTLWLDRIGPEYIELAFRWAHEADPDARLIYNDYGGEGDNPKSDAIYKLVRDLRERGVPIHGVGMQMHIGEYDAPWAPDVAANMQRLAELGLDVYISEMDVRLGMPASPESLTAQAQLYRTMLEVCMSAPNCKALTLWGMTDKYSWIPKFFPGTGVALIFDEAYEPKPAYVEMMKAME